MRMTEQERRIRIRHLKRMYRIRERKEKHDKKVFSMMVDEALEKMKKMLESNKAMQELVNGEAGEVGEKAM